MSQGRTPTAATKATIAELAKPRTVDTVNPIAARFVYSLRLIALHQRAKRDPISELATRLNSVNVAAKTLALAQMVLAVWPENTTYFKLPSNLYLTSSMHQLKNFHACQP